MFRSMMVALMLLSVVAVNAQQTQGRRIEHEFNVQWDGVDTINIDGADTVVSDTFNLYGYPYKTLTVTASQANDSVDVNALKLYLSTTTHREKFLFVRDINADTTYAMIHEWGSATGWSAPFSESRTLALPKCHRGYFRVITGGDSGNNMKLEIQITEEP